MYGNLLNTLAGFLLASTGSVDIGLGLAVLSGTALVIASACVINNYIDRDIDALMQRTRQRALPSGAVSVRAALIYAGILGIAGFSLLLIFTNALTALVGLTGYLAYLALYGWAKRHTVHGTLVGSISGAIPPVAGYTAVAGQLDMGALLLFGILVFWQMPHFYAIAIYRLKDYRAAHIPVLPAVKGIAHTKRHMIAYVAGFTAVAPLLTAFGYTGVVYAMVTLATGLWWLSIALKGRQSKDDEAWARRMFGASLSITMIMLVALSLGSRLP